MPSPLDIFQQAPRRAAGAGPAGHVASQLELSAGRDVGSAPLAVGAAADDRLSGADAGSGSDSVLAGRAVAGERRVGLRAAASHRLRYIRATSMNRLLPSAVGRLAAPRSPRG